MLAIIVTALQGYEYLQAPFTIADSVFGSAFFASTGLHGIHVIVGTIFILVGLVRIINYHFSNNQDDRGDPVIQLAPPITIGQPEFDQIESILRTVLKEAANKI